MKGRCEVWEVENHRVVFSVPAHGKLLGEEKKTEPSICLHLEDNKEENRKHYFVEQVVPKQADLQFWDAPS